VSFVATLCAAVLVPQIEVRPVPAVVGQPVEVVVRGASGPARVEVTLTLPDGTVQSLGDTGAAGRLEFVPNVTGPHLCTAVVDGARVLAPFAAVPHATRWWWCFATAPLALWLLWREFSARARDRRAP